MSDLHQGTSSKELYLRLLRYAKPYLKIFALSLIAMIVAAGTEPAFARLMKPLVDGNFTKTSGTNLMLVPALIVGLFLLRAVASFINDYASAWLSTRIVLDLRTEMFNRLLTLPVRYFDDQPAGTLLSRIAFDVSNVTQAGLNIITVVVKDGFTIVSLMALLLYTDWQLTLICFTAIPLAAASIRYTGKRLRGLSRGQQQAMAETTQVLEEAINGQRIVKIFGGQEYENNRFHALANLLRRNSVKQVASSSINTGLTQLLVSVALAVVIYFASVRAASGAFTAGDFVSFITAMTMMFGPLKRITSVNDSLQRGLAAAESVFTLLDQQPEIDKGTQQISRAKGQIELRDVQLYYQTPDRLALKAINLTIRPGETIALVGSSGSGKTTLVNLLPLFYRPTGGQILIDGTPIEAIQLASLRDNISLVSQEVVLFNDSVSANIAYGRLRNTAPEKIRQAAQDAFALDFIEKMPQGFDTLIGEKGVRLSGGQRQRLAIARALLKDSPILILDEATSALDTQSERQVQAALERLMQGRTTIVIAHRLSTIENADRIVVMSHGEIVEVGSHAELLAKDGHYALLHRMQFREESAA